LLFTSSAENSFLRKNLMSGGNKSTPKTNDNTSAQLAAKSRLLRSGISKICKRNSINIFSFSPNYLSKESKSPCKNNKFPFIECEISYFYDKFLQKEENEL